MIFEKFTKELDFERGPIRPPSESGSLLFRIIRNCPWNRCSFCPVYKEMKFQKRSLDDILTDIRTAGMIVEENRSLANALGYGDSIPRTVVLHVLRENGLTDAYQSVAVWLHRGGRTVFL